MHERHLFIDGRWRAAQNGRRLAINDPAIGEPVGLTALAAAADIDAAVNAAERAFPGWAATHLDARARVLHRAADLILERLPALAELLTREQGKPIPDAEKELRFGVEVIRYYTEEGRRIGGAIRASPRNDIRTLVVSSPVGVVGAITPWNYPVDIFAWKLSSQPPGSWFSEGLSPSRWSTRTPPARRPPTPPTTATTTSYGDG
jgi:succinate-semialdehyde dehydrogenase / glutarate-semialdehyde dehydrogenase